MEHEPAGLAVWNQAWHLFDTSDTVKVVFFTFAIGGALYAAVQMGQTHPDGVPFLHLVGLGLMLVGAPLAVPVLLIREGWPLLEAIVAGMVATGVLVWLHALGSLLRWIGSR